MYVHELDRLDRLDRQKSGPRKGTNGHKKRSLYSQQKNINQQRIRMNCQYVNLYQKNLFELKKKKLPHRRKQVKHFMKLPWTQSFKSKYNEVLTE